MCPWARGLRWRGTELDGLLARPDSPSRCTLPITELREMPPSSPAIWLADNPSLHSFFSSSTRSSVQFMANIPLPRSGGSAESVPSLQRAENRPPGTLRSGNFRKRVAAQDIVSTQLKATIWRDSCARVPPGFVHRFDPLSRLLAGVIHKRSNNAATTGLALRHRRAIAAALEPRVDRRHPRNTMCSV